MAKKSRIQEEADAIFDAAETEMDDVVTEQPQHGMALRFQKSTKQHTWIFEDGFRKAFDAGKKRAQEKGK